MNAGVLGVSYILLNSSWKGAPSNHILKTFVTCIFSLTQLGCIRKNAPSYFVLKVIVFEYTNHSKNRDKIYKFCKIHLFKICPIFSCYLEPLVSPMSFWPQMLLGIFFLAYFHALKLGQVNVNISRRKVVISDIQTVEKDYFCPNVSTLYCVTWRKCYLQHRWMWKIQNKEKLLVLWSQLQSEGINPCLFGFIVSLYLQIFYLRYMLQVTRQ